jgi:hypothetical protein
MMDPVDPSWGLFNSVGAALLFLSGGAAGSVPG